MSNMRFSLLGRSTTLHQESSSSGLAFHVASSKWKVGAALALTLAAATGALLWNHSGIEVPIELCLLATASLLGTLRPYKTTLQVDAAGLKTTGDLGGRRRAMFQLPWKKICELHYGPGGNGEVGGLYVREGTWCSRCILPRVTEAQADVVILAIAERYPSVLPTFSQADSRGRAQRSATSRRLVPSGWRTLGRPRHSWLARSR